MKRRWRRTRRKKTEADGTGPRLVLVVDAVEGSDGGTGPVVVAIVVVIILARARQRQRREARAGVLPLKKRAAR